MNALSRSVICLMAVLILGLAGCANTTGTPAGLEQDPHIIMGKQFYWLKNLQSEMVTEQNGAMSIVLQGTSSSMQKHQLYVRTEWFKANGMPVKSLLSRWEPVQLLPKMPFTYTKAAPSNEVVDYRILITDSLN